MPRKTKCAVCGGTLQKKTITHTQPWGDQLYRFEKVPAAVCVQCGEIWLDASTTQLIDDIIQKKQRKPKRYQKVPVFSLAEAPEAH